MAWIRQAPRFIPVPALLAIVASTMPAHADVPPPNECATTASVGSACTTAGPSFNEDGVCTSATCTSASPPPNGSTFACVLCELADASVPTRDAGLDAHGTQDASDATVESGADGGDGGHASTDGSASNVLSGSTGCSVSPARRPRGEPASTALGAGLAALVAFATTARRRRRKGRGEPQSVQAYD